MKIKKGKSLNLKVKRVKKEENKYTDLRDVLDYTRDFSMFYSGVENDTYFQGCYDMGVRNFLMSYHYLQKMRIPLYKKYGELKIKFFIDSGAFTYMQDPKYADYDIAHWEKHIDKYLNWAENNREYIFAIANFDLEYLVGGSQVQEWNQKFFESFMLRTGIPVCFVWHENSDMPWDKYCQRYPYVGFSSVSDAEKVTNDLSYFKDKLRIAEKYNALVHGMGMTRTGVLPQLPFYTVDSTSWKSGFMYGKLMYWNGKKTVSVGKESFETAFKYIRGYSLNPPIDEEKIYDYYEPEVLRANVHAYQLAEESIRNKLKPLTYWKKEKAIKRSNIDSVNFPSPEYLLNISANSEGLREYAKELNINSEADGKDLRDLICDATCFTHFEDERYKPVIDKEYTDEIISSMHANWVNKIRNTIEEKIEDLKQFYLSNVLGEVDTLLQYGTNFDRKVKERDEYITDEEYDLVDVSDMEIENLAAKFLPLKDEDRDGDPMEDISKLDDEIFEENGIIPVRDERGRFLKGQKEVLKPKTLYSNKFPKLSCTTCVNAQKCPEYKEGYVCAFNKMFDRYDTRNMDDVIQGMQGIADLAMIRLQRAMITETMNGGIPDPAVSQLMNQTMSLYSGIQKMYQNQSHEIIRQTQVLRNDGTRETVTSVSTNPQGGGILEKLFGDLGKSNNEKMEIDIEAEEVQ